MQTTSRQTPLQTSRPSRAAVSLALVLVATLFAGNFLWIRVVVHALPPLVMQAFRFVVAGAALFAFASERSRAPRPTLAQWARAAGAGALLVAIGQGCVSWAEQYVGAGLTVLVTSTIPMWVALLGALFFRERVGPLALAGMAIGFAGLLPIVLASGTEARTAGAVAALIVSSLAWALGSLYTARIVIHADALVATGMQLSCGGAMLAIASIATGEAVAIRPQAFDTTIELGIAYLTVVGGIGAYTLYVWLLHNARPAVASMFTYLQAILGVALGALLLHERFPPGILIGGVAVVTGVGCVVASRR
ncbi:MAG: EamA family transporter [Candidatus Eremiobacteraeota bacterium]|nr:EamA family transporter [Candidatus Eremiobacteraeota bacterium]